MCITLRRLGLVLPTGSQIPCVLHVIVCWLTSYFGDLKMLIYHLFSWASSTNLLMQLTFFLTYSTTGAGDWGLKFSKYTSRITTFRDFRHYVSGVLLYAHFKNFRLALLACYLFYQIEWKYIYVTSLSFDNILLIMLKSQGNICIIHILSAFVKNYNTPPPLTYSRTVHSYLSMLSESVEVQVHEQCTYNL